MPKRFCNNRETSELFRLGSIILYLRLHGTYSATPCTVNVQVQTSVPRCTLGIGHPPGCVGTSCGRSRTDQLRPMSVSTRSQISVLTAKRAAREASRLSRKHKAYEAIAKTGLMTLVAAIAVQLRPAPGTDLQRRIPAECTMKRIGFFKLAVSPLPPERPRSASTLR
jgi:hypothetical protein